MSTLRERKVTSSSSADDSSSSNQQATSSAPTTTASVDPTSSLYQASNQQQTQTVRNGVPDTIPLFEDTPLMAALRLAPFICLFFFIFFSISVVSTGTLSYGLSTAPQLKPLRIMLNRAKIRVQEFVGIRPPRKKATPNSNSADGGYGGVSKKKKKKKNQQQKDSHEGQSPPSDVTDGSGASEDTPAAPEPLLDIRPPAVRDPKEVYLTLEELAQHNGEGGTSIFLAVHGRIFDVTAGREFYGVGHSYSNLAAKDASRAFATNCYNNQGLHDLRGLTDDQRRGIDHWYKFYNEHAKYRPVGWVIMPEIPADAPLPVDTC